MDLPQPLWRAAANMLTCTISVDDGHTIAHYHLAVDIRPGR